MNYLKQVLAFYDLQIINPLSSGQVALWHALMAINNKCSWIERFTVANQTLEAYAGLSQSAIYKNRNVLKQKGYIDFKTNGANRATEYQVLVLYDDASTSGSNSSSNSSSTSSSTSTSNSSSNTLNKQDKTKTKLNKKNSPQSPKRYADDSDYMALAKRLYAYLTERNPGHKEPNWQKWADDFRKLVELDKRSLEDVKKVLKWSQNDDFWQDNIQSPDKLRKQFDRLYPLANKPAGRPYYKRAMRQESLPGWFDESNSNFNSASNTTSSTSEAEVRERLRAIMGKSNGGED